MYDAIVVQDSLRLITEALAADACPGIDAANNSNHRMTSGACWPATCTHGMSRCSLARIMTQGLPRLTVS